jgi:hypothetical protein
MIVRAAASRLFESLIFERTQGSIGTISFWVTSVSPLTHLSARLIYAHQIPQTYFSYPRNDFPSLGLIDGALRAYTPSGEWKYNNASAPGHSGGELFWTSSPTPTFAVADSDFSVVIKPGTDTPVLAVYGISDLWTLCFYSFHNQWDVRFNTTAIPVINDPLKCFPVTLNVIPFTSRL